MSDDLVRPELNAALRRHTPARVGLRRAGVAQATPEQLEFQLDHALARDAVHARMDVKRMLDDVQALGLDAVAVRSAVTESAEDRQIYLRRPDLGRRLAETSAEELRARAKAAEIVFVLADGLSALAVERHALPVLQAVLARTDVAVGPVCVVSQGRVAIGDEIGEILGARLVVLLIGERPGLSAADSLGVYVTWQPKVGRTDAERNCISNVRAEGLSYADAAERIVWLMHEARRLGSTGVSLKVGAGNPLIA